MTMNLHETLRGGQTWSRRMARHQRLLIRDVEGRACVSALLYNARDPVERYNMPDTLKGQFTAFLTAGRVLYSDMGRILCSIVADDCGWHDTISGLGRAEEARGRFGDGTYQELRNDFHRNARDNLLVELGKHGLGKRDVVSNVNFFVRIDVDDDGVLAWHPGNSRRGACVELRFEMDTLVVLTNTPHPLDPEPRYQPPAVDVWVGSGLAPGAEDRCRTACLENGRGFQLTEAYAAEMAGSR